MKLSRRRLLQIATARIANNKGANTERYGPLFLSLTRRATWLPHCLHFGARSVLVGTCPARRLRPRAE
jgi:hypothetical protein